MRQQLFKTIVLITLLIPLVAMGSHPKWKGKYTKEKKINKEFNVSADALLKINNSYGNLYVTSWNENRVVIEVHIKTNGNNESKVQKKLDEIDVAFDTSRSMVAAKTKFAKKTWNWNWGKSNNVSMQINYTIKVPVSNNVDLSNDYGSINLDKIDGNARISCDYGRIDIGQLNGNENVLNFDYTKKSTIDFIKTGKIVADYSGYEVGEAGKLVVNADYTSSKINNVKNIQYSCDYGSLTVDNLGNIQGSGDYVKVRLGRVNGSVDTSSDYGSLKIQEMTADANNIRIRSDYTGITIGYHPNYNFNFEFKLEYARLRGGDDFNFNIKREKSSERYYKGSHGSSGNNTVSVTADYGSLTFIKN